MNGESCHGMAGCLQSGSRRRLPNPAARPWQKFRSYVVWHIENLGMARGLKTLLLGFRRKGTLPAEVDTEAVDVCREVLRLQPGEWVEVKPVEEILATLDRHRRHKGLLWMTGMSKYCGKQYRVHQRVARIILESTGELRNMKNTVLLEGAMCDGKEFGGCDRSCFHFWREAWLKRVSRPNTRFHDETQYGDHQPRFFQSRM